MLFNFKPINNIISRKTFNYLKYPHCDSLLIYNLEYQYYVRREAFMANEQPTTNSRGIVPQSELSVALWCLCAMEVLQTSPLVKPARSTMASATEGACDEC